MSESNNLVLFPLLHGVEHDVPADNRRSDEQELQQILRRLTTDMSALAKVKALPRAKVLYESLHPETRHGGDRITAKQVSNSRTWSTFTKHVADTCGISQSTVYTHLRWAERLATLTPEAECEANATALANQLGTLARIAALPDPVIQRDLALRFDRQRTQVKKELAEREREFGLPTPSRSRKKAHEPIDAEQEVSPASDNSEKGVAGGVEEANHADLVSGERSKSFDDARAREPGLEAIEAMVGASTLDGCLDAIRGLQEDRSEIEELRSKLKHVEAKCAKLESHLALYERAPLSELFRMIGVTNVHDAIERTRALVGVSSAAE